MPRRISEETKGKIWDLFRQGKSYEEIASITNTSQKTAWIYSQLRKMGLKSHTDYEIHLIKRKGYKSRTEYEISKARERGYKSLAEYSKSLAEERQQKDANIAFSCFLAEKIKEYSMSQSELARQLGVSRQAVSMYVQGKMLPEKEILLKIYSILEVPYQTIDDLLER